MDLLCMVLSHWMPVLDNFMAEAASAAAAPAPAQQQTGGPPADQGYNSYP
ncbi:hypothetical protein A2U01_0033146, partial [Trifolium medium]|nr:hypothetical protein [Trifolium medium]